MNRDSKFLESPPSQRHQKLPTPRQSQQFGVVLQFFGGTHHAFFLSVDIRPPSWYHLASVPGWQATSSAEVSIQLQKGLRPSCFCAYLQGRRRYLRRASLR